MRVNIRVIRVFLLVILFWINGNELSAQITTKVQEIWPSVDVYYKVNPKIRFYGTAAGTKMSESYYSDGALGVFFDYFSYPIASINKLIKPRRPDSLPGKYIWFRLGYQYSATPPSAKDPFKENMLVTEVSNRFYLPWEILMSVKNRFDWRVKNGDFNSRYRPRIMLEKDLHTEYLYFTVSGFAEYFINFGNSAVNRFRTQLGIEFKVTRHISYEVFWNHQFPNQPEVSELDAFGMTLKAFLHRKKKNKK